MTTVGVLFLFLVNLTAQIVVGNCGLYVPLCAWTIYYFALTLNWRRAMWLTLGAGLALDLVYARNELFSPLILSVFAGTGIFWKVRYAHNTVNAALGGVAATAAGFALLCIPLTHASGEEIAAGTLLAHGIFWCAAAGTLLPLLLRFWDAVLSRLPDYPSFFSGGSAANWRSAVRKSGAPAPSR